MHHTTSGYCFFAPKANGSFAPFSTNFLPYICHFFPTPTLSGILWKHRCSTGSANTQLSRETKKLQWGSLPSPSTSSSPSSNPVFQFHPQLLSKLPLQILFFSDPISRGSMQPFSSNKFSLSHLVQYTLLSSHLRRLLLLLSGYFPCGYFYTQM